MRGKQFNLAAQFQFVRLIAVSSTLAAPPSSRESRKKATLTRRKLIAKIKQTQQQRPVETNKQEVECKRNKADVAQLKLTTGRYSKLAFIERTRSNEPHEVPGNVVFALRREGCGKYAVSRVDF